ncbi:MAG: EamA family transporter [Myxococcales bacterium]|nr:EamA family transporter [Myxococcales bacterium]
MYNLLFRMAHQQPLHEPTYMVVQSGAVFASLLLMGASGLGFRLNAAMAALGVVSGVLGYVTGWSMLYALGRGPTSVTVAIRHLSFVITAGLSVLFLDEGLTVARLVALGMAGTAFFVMGGERNETGRPHPIIWLTLLTAGGMSFFHKLAAMAGVSASAFLMCQSGTAHITAHLVCMRQGGYRLGHRIVGFALTTGAMIAVAMTFGLHALRHADAVVISPMLQLGFLITAPGSFWLFGEPVTVRKVCGLGLGAFAVILFRMSM